MIRREIDGVWYYCVDLTEDETERAKHNRTLVQNKEMVEGYPIEIEIIKGEKYDQPN